MIHKVLKAFKVLSLGGKPVSAMLLYGVAASVEHTGLLRSLDCGHVVDIGANVGQFALISRKCFSDARIDSFEPLTEAADRYEKVFARVANTHLHRLALDASG